MISRIKLAFSKVIKNIRFLLLIKDNYWYKKLKYYGANQYDVTYNKSNGSIYIRELNLSLYKERHIFFLHKIDIAFELKTKCHASFGNEDTKIFITINNIKLYLSTSQELSILHEIFIEDCYNYIISRPSIVVDIGFNVGFASLFLAQDPNVKKIYSFEPFKDTYRDGLLNIKANPQVANKIETFNYGISDKNQSLLCRYSYNLKGDNITTGLISKSKNKEDTKEELIQLESIENTLNKINIDLSKHDLIAKVDCEGGEYEIFEQLDRCQKIRCFKVFMLEWHHNGPDPIKKILKKNNFEVFVLNTKNTHGLIYAINSNPI